MTSREKVRRALRHEAGPVPVDFGSTGVTSLHVSCVAALRRHYGLPEHPVKVCEPFQMLGELEEDLLAALGSDCAGLSGRGTMFGVDSPCSPSPRRITRRSKDLRRLVRARL